MGAMGALGMLNVHPLSSTQTRQASDRQQEEENEGRIKPPSVQG
jgi:hypothetical protein